MPLSPENAALLKSIETFSERDWEMIFEHRPDLVNRFRVVARAQGPTGGGEASYPQSEGEAVPCQSCGQSSRYWHGENRLWNLVMGGAGATDDPGGVVCPNCFIDRAADTGLGRRWVLTDVDPDERSEPEAHPADDKLAVAVEALKDALTFIEGMGMDLLHARIADWYPEGANNAALQMSEDMRLAGNRCSDYEPVAEALALLTAKNNAEGV